MGRPRKLVVEPDADLKGLDAVQYTIAEIIQERCGINGCTPKFHMEEAGIILKKIVKQNLLKDSE